MTEDKKVHLPPDIAKRNKHLIGTIQQITDDISLLKNTCKELREQIINHNLNAEDLKAIEFELAKINVMAFSADAHMKHVMECEEVETTVFRKFSEIKKELKSLTDKVKHVDDLLEFKDEATASVESFEAAKARWKWLEGIRSRMGGIAAIISSAGVIAGFLAYTAGYFDK